MPDLSEREQELVNHGNAMAEWSCELCRSQYKAKCYFTLENPELTWLWVLRCVKQLLKLPGVVFTTLWGPNAIPPLETWSYKKPLIYNDRLEDDVRQGTALIGNIKDPKFIANSIEKILKNRYKKSFILNGYNRLQLIKKNSKRCYINLNKKLSFLI